jgi:hypothetical protein
MKQRVIYYDYASGVVVRHFNVEVYNYAILVAKGRDKHLKKGTRKCWGYSVSSGILQIPGLRITPYWRYQSMYLRTLYAVLDTYR